MVATPIHHVPIAEMPITIDSYLATLYTTGEIITDRPHFGVTEETHLATIENFARGCDSTIRLPLLQKQIKSNAFLASLLDSSSLARGDASQPEEDDFSSHFLEVKDLRKLPKPEWLIYDILPSKGISFIYGAPKCGKTFISISMACTVAMSTPADTLDTIDAALQPDTLNWCGYITKHRPDQHVVYIAGEDIDDVAQRVTGWMNYHHVEDIPSLHLFDCPLQLAADTPRFMETINRRYGNINVALFVVDTLAVCSMGVEENSKKEFDTVLRSLEMLWRTYNCCVLVIHHAGRNGEIRGSSAMDGVAYHVMKAEVSDENIVLKSILKRRGKRFEDMYLDRVIVETGGFDEKGEPAATCVIAKSDRKAGEDPNILTKLQGEIIDHMNNLGSKNVPRTELMKACMIDKSKESSFVNAMSGLLKKGMISMNKARQRTTYDVILGKGEKDV